MKNIEPYKVSNALSELLVAIESELKKNPNITLKDFIASLRFDPRDLLYSQGFSATIYFALIVPLKEALEKYKNKVVYDWDKLRKIRNGLCHGTYTFNGHNLVVVDRDNSQIEITPREAVEISNRLAKLLA
ncbi:MAG: hypothetical protein NZM04_04055 [Methylacidiphilales bacterium]|nr:hypothetical protein [Candidatus Methylacidiphilales bacterium]MDW8350227.1 hypothetical protein [Verrucomicrobiae bacterium]